MNILFTIIFIIIGVITLAWPLTVHTRRPKNVIYYGTEVLGAYDPTNNLLYLHHKLNEYPLLKQKVLEHELGHTKDKNRFMCLVREVKDYFSMKQSEEYLKFEKEVLNQKKPNSNIIHTVGNIYYSLIVAVVVCFVIVYGWIIKVVKWLKQRL